MKVLRNREVAQTCAVMSLFGLLCCGVGFWIDFQAGQLAFILTLGFLVLYLWDVSRRHRRIENMAEEINKILHGEETLMREEYEEGELSILQSEIYKMTVRLREQQYRLQQDKVFLADSIADISHQIRTPLTSINLIVTRLSDPNLSREKQSELIHELFFLLSRIDWLITALLKMSKLDAGTVQFVEETVPAERLLKLAAEPILVPVELREQELIIEGEGMFTGDVSWTSEAVTNILKNCMEHTPAGGRIVVKAQENPLYFEIVISDNGSGIHEDDLPHIFERFYKGKNSDGKSFGIGLALARMIVTSQNGTVKAENRREGGARFTLRFYKGAV